MPCRFSLNLPLFGLRPSSKGLGTSHSFSLLRTWNATPGLSLGMHPYKPLPWSHQWTPKFSEGDCKGQNSLDWKVSYIIGKLLECRCLKWARMTHLDTWNTSYGQKKGQKSNHTIWLLTTKSQESPRFPFVQVACHIPLEISRRGLQLCFKPHLNRRSAHKVMGPQSCGNPSCGNFVSPTWESQDKMSFGCGPRGEAQSIL